MFLHPKAFSSSEPARQDTIHHWKQLPDTDYSYSRCQGVAPSGISVFGRLASPHAVDNSAPLGIEVDAAV